MKKVITDTQARCKASLKALVEANGLETIFLSFSCCLGDVAWLENRFFKKIVQSKFKFTDENQKEDSKETSKP